MELFGRIRRIKRHDFVGIGVYLSEEVCLSLGVGFEISKAMLGPGSPIRGNCYCSSSKLPAMIIADYISRL